MWPRGIKIWVWAAVWSWGLGIDGFMRHGRRKVSILLPQGLCLGQGDGNIILIDYQNFAEQLQSAAAWWLWGPPCDFWCWSLVLGPRIMEMDLSSVWLFSKKQQFVFMYKPEHCLPGVWPCQAPVGGLLWRTRRNKCELSGWSPWWGWVQKTTAGTLRSSLGQMGLLVLSFQSCWDMWGPGKQQRECNLTW